MRKLILSFAMVFIMASNICTAKVAGLPSAKLIKSEKYKIQDNDVAPQTSTTSTGEPTHGCQGEFKPGITNEKVDDVASIISEPFEDYAANDYLVQQAVNQGKEYWTTWSNSPGSSEDPLVSDAFAYEGDNSVVINGTSDAVLLFNETGFTQGQFDIDFMVLIPAGFNGYFSTLQYFNGVSSEWGMQAYFDVGGAGLVDAGGAGAGVFNYTYDTWHNVHLMIDLDMDYAEMYFNGEMLVSWMWSGGSFGTGALNELHAMNFYAWANNGTPGAYFDNIGITSDVNPNNFYPPTNLVGELIGFNDVLLTWDAPGTFPPEWITYSQGAITNSIGSGEAANFDVAARFTPDMLSGFIFGAITKINFVPGEDDAICTYTLKVWQGIIPTLIYAQEVSGLVADTWNEITLDTPVPFESTQELWFGFNCNTTAGYPAGCDDGPQDEGFGNMIFWNGAWTTLTALNEFLTYNWAVQGFVESAIGAAYLNPITDNPVTAINYGTPVERMDKIQPPAIFAPTSRALTGYNVYRDGVKIASNVQNTQYTDQGIGYYFYTWYVTAQYDEGESGPSNSVVVELPIGINEFDATTFSIYPNPTNGIVNIKSNVDLRSVRLVNLTGQVVYFRNISGMELQINASEFGVGIYTLQLETEAGLTVRKLIVQ